MKISEIEVYQVGEESSNERATWASNSIILKLTTSDGVIGYGEAVPTLRVQPVIHSLHEVSRFFKGKDPLNTETNLHEWHKHDFYLPVSFESTTAVSAFDIACWDIIGKHFGAPIHQLTGGTFRKKVKLYANGWYNGCRTPDQFGKRSAEVTRQGYKALKFDPFGAYYDYIDQKGLKLAFDRVKAVRDVVGDDVQLLIEHHGRFNPNSAVMIARRLRELNPLFMEEPVHPENIDGLKKYRSLTDVRIALGERILTKEEATFMMSNHLVDFLQVDITNVGGVTQSRKIAGIAEAYGVEMAFHNAFGSIQNAVTIQLDASIPNFLLQESFYDFFPAWKRALVKDQSKVKNGYTEVPTKPGLGIEVDEKILETHRVHGQEYFNPDEPVWVVKGTWTD